ncbi:hypothetical protein AHAS_Ahas09G0144200 [Arachis hypogaea]
MGVALEHQGVARWFKFPEKRLKIQTLGRATWCQRRGIPTLTIYLGVPLEYWVWHTSYWSKEVKKHALWACHANYVFQRSEDGSSWAWHANCWSWQASGKKNKKEDPGCATWIRRRGTPGMPTHKACHSKSWAWRAKPNLVARHGTPLKRQQHAKPEGHIY